MALVIIVLPKVCATKVNISITLTLPSSFISPSLSQNKIFQTKNSEKFLKQKNRRDIVDRNGSVLARDVILYDVGVRPKLLNEDDKKNLLIKLALQFPEKDLNDIKLKLSKEKFIVVAKIVKLVLIFRNISK